jgi:O-antigen polysaccharide polymerase Wzy
LLNQLATGRSRTRASKDWLALFHCLVLMLLVVLCLEFADFSLQTVLLIAVICSLYVPMIWRLKELDLFEPLVFANLALGVMFVAKPLYDAATSQSEVEYFGLVMAADFDYTLAIVLAGIIAFQIGYHSRLTVAVFAKYAKVLPSGNRGFRPTKAGQLGILFAVIGLTLLALFAHEIGGLGALLTMAKGRGGSSDDSLFLSSNGYFSGGILALIPASALLFAAGLAAKRVGWFIGSGLAAAIPCSFFLGRGDRSNLLPLLSIPMLWYMVRRRRPSVLILTVFAALIIPAINILRETRTLDVYYARSDIEDAFVQPWNAALDTLRGDVDMFECLASEVAIMPSVLNYQHGAIIRDLVVRAIPRPVWPGKPTEATDLIGQVLWPAHYAVARAGPASSIIGNLYADSGIVTVVLGMLLIGAGFRWFWLWYLKYRDCMAAKLLYASTVPFVVILLRGSFPDTFSRMLFVVGPVLVAQRVLTSDSGRLPPVERAHRGRGL